MEDLFPQVTTLLEQIKQKLEHSKQLIHENAKSLEALQGVMDEHTESMKRLRLRKVTKPARGA